MILGVAIYRRCAELGHGMGRGDLGPNEGRALTAKAWRSHKLRAQLHVVVGVHVDARQGLVTMAG